MSWLYILEIKPLLVASFANIFSQSIGESIGLFTLFMAFFAMQKLVSLIKSHLFIFALISIALEDWLKKILVWFVSENVLPMVPSRSAMMPYLQVFYKKYSIYLAVLGLCCRFSSCRVRLSSSKHGLICSMAWRILRPLVKQMVKNLPAIQETQFDPWVGTIPWRRERQPTLVFVTGKSYGQGSQRIGHDWVTNTFLKGLNSLTRNGIHISCTALQVPTN